jgi:hypothetical protein
MINFYFRVDYNIFGNYRYNLIILLWRLEWIIILFKHLDVYNIIINNYIKPNNEDKIRWELELI